MPLSEIKFERLGFFKMQEPNVANLKNVGNKNDPNGLNGPRELKTVKCGGGNRAEAANKDVNRLESAESNGVKALLLKIVLKEPWPMQVNQFN